MTIFTSLKVQNAAANVGLHLNAVKTQAIVHNQDPALSNQNQKEQWLI